MVNAQFTASMHAFFNSLINVLKYKTQVTASFF